jgi:hypothetical protein
VTAAAPGRGGLFEIEAPIVCRRTLAERIGRRRMARQAAARDEIVARLGPAAALRLEAGDLIRFSGRASLWRVAGLRVDEQPSATFVRAEVVDQGGADAAVDWRPGPVDEPPAPPRLHLLDLPLRRSADAPALLAAVAGEPWRGVELLAGPSLATLRSRARVLTPSTMGMTLSPLAPGPVDRLHRAGELLVRVEGEPALSRSWLDVAAGANTIAVRRPDGEWEIVQFLSAELVAPDRYRLRGLLRRRTGPAHDSTGTLPAGADVVVLDERLGGVEVGSTERGSPLLWRAVPLGASGEALATEADFTWRGLAFRPLAPVQLRARRLPDGAVRISWIRQTRIAGDGWAGEPPLSEEAEAYRMEVLVDGLMARAWEVDRAAVIYTREQIEMDLPDRPVWVTVRVRQGSTSYGWGSAVDGRLRLED